MILKCQQHTLLCEALRRYTRFHNKESLTQAWTGLGFPSEYKMAIKAGLMDYVFDNRTPRIMHWYKLTDRGAEIVQDWLDLGFTYEDIESGYTPSLKINEKETEK